MSPAAVRLLIEVSSRPPCRDLIRKAALYVRARLPNYRVVDVKRGRIVRLHEPGGDNYGEQAKFPFGAPVPAPTNLGVVVDTGAF